MICTAAFLILSSIIVVVAGIMIETGIIDIASCYSQIEDRISYIETEKEKGNYDLVLDQIVCNTKYPGCAGLKKLNTQDPTAWQNGQIEQYFGLKSVLGKETVNQ